MHRQHYSSDWTIFYGYAARPITETTGAIRTRFDDDGLSIATNHEGWDVQHLTDSGWRPVNDKPIESKADANTLLTAFQEGLLRAGIPVYEAVHTVLA